MLQIANDARKQTTLSALNVSMKGSQSLMEFVLLNVREPISTITHRVMHAVLAWLDASNAPLVINVWLVIRGTSSTAIPPNVSLYIPLNKPTVPQ